MKRLLPTKTLRTPEIDALLLPTLAALRLFELGLGSAEHFSTIASLANLCSMAIEARKEAPPKALNAMIETLAAISAQYTGSAKRGSETPWSATHAQLFVIRGGLQAAERVLRRLSPTQTLLAINTLLGIAPESDSSA